LILRFTTDTQQAQRGLTEFARQGGASLVDFSTKAKQGADALGNLASKSDSLKSFTQDVAIIGTLAGAFELLSAAARKAQEDIAELVTISRDASAAGVGTTFFQAYTDQAAALGVETSVLVDELKKAKEATTISIGQVGNDDKGKASAATAIDEEVKAGNLNKGASTSFAGAGDQEAKIRVMLGLLDELDKKGAKLAEYDLANKFFGASFEQRLRDGEDAIGNMKEKLDEARVSGGKDIIPADQIQAAQRMQAEIAALNDRLASVTKPLTDDIRGIFLEIDELLIAIEGAIVSGSEELAGFLTSGHAIHDILATISEIIHSWVGDGYIASAVDAVVDFANRWTGAGDIIQTVKTYIRGITNAVRELAGMEDLPDDHEITIHAKSAAPKKPDTSKALPAAADKSGGSDDQDKVEDYINSLKKEVAAEKSKADTLGLSNQAQREALDLAKAREIASQDDRTLTSEEIASIKAQSDAYAAAETRINQFNKAQESAKAQAQFLGNEFESSVEKMAMGGGKLRDVMLDVAKSIEQAALKAAILGEGPLAGLFGTGAGGANGEGKGFGGLGGLLGLATSGFGAKSADAAQDAAQDASDFGIVGGGSAGLLGGIGKLFSGFFADGGTIPAGGWGVAGEKGAEIISGPGTVTPVGAIQKAMGSMGSSASGGVVTHAPTYNILPAGGVTPDQLTAAIDKSNQQFARNLVPIMANAQRRFG
jgi:hypothetical protein